MGTKLNFMWSSPWQILGGYKYVIGIPFLVKAIHANYYGGYDVDNWCFHMIWVTIMRLTLSQLWQIYSRLHGIVKKHQISTVGFTFEQIDREFHSDDYIILQALVATAAHVWVPGFRQLPLWDSRGLVTIILLHVGPTEFVYYWLHRALHTNFLFTNYHSFHHASINTEPPTSGVGTFLEHVLFSGVMGIALAGPVIFGGASISMIYLYCLFFDFMKHMAHSNTEIIPITLFKAFPLLKYLLITPSYHSLHHSELHSNYCLFMPLYDHLGGTVNVKSEALHARLREGRAEEVPEFVFLAHCVDLLSSMHVSFVLRQFASRPYSARWFLYPFLVLITPVMFMMWAWGKVFVAYKYTLDKFSCQTWVVPRYGFQYFIPVGLNSINGLIESAILEADKKGVKVISLAALNKNEALNGGGVLFTDKHTNLRVRVVHGNTLTAACILKGIPEDVTEVFITGATSKLGRAIALHLCRRRVRVLMLTSSQERFEAILKEAPKELKRYLVRVTKYQAGINCKTWIMGKWISHKDQQMAPRGTHFHQFVVPGIPEIRKDCTYGKLAAMRLPTQVKGISTCEFSCERGVVHACHAGGLIHCLEGWTHHEVGSIDVDRIDEVWEAAMRHGFSAVY
ncbi:aldehyde decarbonylase [Marchantia polymorpha subsp. ruderalis]